MYPDIDLGIDWEQEAIRGAEELVRREQPPLPVDPLAYRRLPPYETPGLLTEPLEEFPAEPPELPPPPEPLEDQNLSDWQDFLSGLSQPEYVQHLTQIAQLYGPEFATRIIQPRQEPTGVEPLPVTELPSTLLEEETPWYLKPIEWLSEQPAIKPILNAYEEYRKRWLIPAALTIAKPYSQELQQELAGKSIFSIPASERQEIWEESSIPWLAKLGAEAALDPRVISVGVSLEKRCKV